MIHLVIGGSASGKSEYAEQIATAFAAPRYYIATMRPQDAECERRIEKHRKMRAQKGFTTLEWYENLAEKKLPRRGVVLLECMSNLVANEMFSASNEADAETQSAAQRGAACVEFVLRGMDALFGQAEHVVVVTNDVFADGVDYDAGTLQYLCALAQINCALAARCDALTEVVCGIPLVLKQAHSAQPECAPSQQTKHGGYRKE